MKRIETFEKANRENFKEFGLNIKVLSAYWASVESEKDMIDFNDVIWDNEVEEIVNCLNEYGIEEFSISSTFSSLIQTLALFDKFGFKLDSIIHINTGYDIFKEQETFEPAIRMIKK